MRSRTLCVTVHLTEEEFLFLEEQVKKGGLVTPDRPVKEAIRDVAGSLLIANLKEWMERGQPCLT